MAPGALTSGWRVALGAAVLAACRRGSGRNGMRPARMRPSAMVRAIVVATVAATVLILAARSLAPSGPPAPDLLRLGAAMGSLLVLVRALLQFAARRAAGLVRGRSRRSSWVPALSAGSLSGGCARTLSSAFCPSASSTTTRAVAGRTRPRRDDLGPDERVAGGPRTQRRTPRRLLLYARPDSEVLPALRECQRLGIDVSVMPRLFENVTGACGWGAARGAAVARVASDEPALVAVRRKARVRSGDRCRCCSSRSRRSWRVLALAVRLSSAGRSCTDGARRPRWAVVPPC